jgi:hypothetical protein
MLPLAAQMLRSAVVVASIGDLRCYRRPLPPVDAAVDRGRCSRRRPPMVPWSVASHRCCPRRRPLLPQMLPLAGAIATVGGVGPAPIRRVQSGDLRR